MKKLLILLIIALAGGAIWYFLIGSKPENRTAKEYWEEGWRLLDDGEIEGAIGVMEKAAERYPNDANIQCCLAICYHRCGDEKTARALFKRTLELNAGFHAARVAYAASILKTEEDKKKAWNMVSLELRKIPQKAFEDPAVLYNMACLYAANNRPQLALQYLSRAIQIDPSTSREEARDDPDFDSIRGVPEFKRLVY
jgi:tetratricopeptide (TPR) repeat protein